MYLFPAVLLGGVSCYLKTAISCQTCQHVSPSAAQLAQSAQASICHCARWLTASSSARIDQLIDSVSHLGQCYDDETAIWTSMQSDDVSVFTPNLESRRQHLAAPSSQLTNQ